MPKPKKGEQQQKEPYNMEETAPVMPGPLSGKAKITLNSARSSSWQVLLGFGVSFAVRVGFLGFWLGGWIDRRFLGDTGYGALLIILLVIGYSFYMLYQDVMRQDKRQKRLVAEALQKEQKKQAEKN
ncbi:MAG TPA: AtpZ/AtpI family protein [Candidatus Avidehalobacter gallistercoris]|uniref:AtpZ/AtpI family protein n=1 Tax=Candidatus Avidehalobacter gallistercoris TaxID=2840694 RepID=A0A9D1KY85_9FIRM|nr:AtpZ/AtpI family protein [Candidatus Avidehalobacter gallistercoris]